MKNSIICFLLLMLSGFYNMPGWVVSGNQKILIFIFLSFCGGLALSYIESMLKSIFKAVRSC